MLLLHLTSSPMHARTHDACRRHAVFTTMLTVS